MLAFLKSLFSLFGKVAEYFANRQLIEAGKAEKTVQEIQEVEKHVEEAKTAITVPDPARDERLRNRFDRSRNGSK